MPHEGYFNKIFNTHVAVPHMLLETIITCKNHHMQKSSHARELEIKTKEGKKCTKQHNHKYEICLMEMI